MQAEGVEVVAAGRGPASECEREAVLVVLARAVGNGHLDLREYDDRTRTAVHARTRAELATTLHGLPTPPSAPASAPTAGPASGPSTSGAAPEAARFSAPALPDLVPADVATVAGGVPAAPDLPPVATTQSDRAWAAAGHLLGPVTSVVGPLLVLALRGSSSRFVRDQAAEALNFQITFLLALVALIPVSVVTLGLGGVLYAFLPVVWLVLSVLGGARAGAGERYRYPWTLRVVR